MKSNLLIIKLIIIFFVFSLGQVTKATELWVKNETASSRFFLSPKKNNNGIQLNQFHQNKGEYQTLVKNFRFHTKADLDAFVFKYYPDYRAQAKLDFWPIKNNESEIVNKAFFGRSRNQSIWEAKNRWNNDWELKFGQWLKQEVTLDFYKKYNIPTDCADAVIGLRWIFSRINYLPVANTLSDTGNLFGQFSMKKEWKRLPTATNWYEDQLFLAALDQVMNLTTSKSIMSDGFPVKLSREGLIAGTYVVTQNPSNGHARILAEINYDDITELPIFTLASTSPRAVRNLNKEIYLDQDWPKRGELEILAFRWPVVINSNWQYEDYNKRASYSLEQFDPAIQKNFPHFFQYLFSKVKGNYDPIKLVDLGVADILAYVEQRKQIVDNGHDFCAAHTCPVDSSEFDDWSTPSRDSKLLKKFSNIDVLVKQFEPKYPGLTERWARALRLTTTNVLGLPISLSQVRYLFENNFYSSIPTDSVAKRWGFNANEILGTWLSSYIQLLNERNLAITRTDSPCSDDCQANTIKWQSLNTYHVDAKLDLLYSNVKTYCSIVGDKTCSEIINANFPGPLTYNGQTLNLKNYLSLTPFFNSDPRVSFDRRWGKIPANIIATEMPSFESIKISTNKLALLDSSKLINLSNGKILFQTDTQSRLFLTKNGNVYKVNDSKAIIAKMIISEGVVSWQDIEDADQLLKEEPNRLILMKEDSGYTIFQKPLKDSTLTFRIVEDHVEFLKESTGATRQYGPLLSAVVDTHSISFIDLDRKLNVNMPMPAEQLIYDLNVLEISSYKYPTAILKYADKNADRYYSFIIDLEKKTWTKIAPNFTEKYIVLWSDTYLKKAIIQTDFNKEFHQLYAVNWDETNQFNLLKLSNRLMDLKVINSNVYLIDGTGGDWDPNPKNKLYLWGQTIEEVKSPADFDVKQLLDFGAYYSNSEKAQILNFTNSTAINLPHNLFIDQKSGQSLSHPCQMQKEGSDIFSYRFDSSYGAYLCMGGTLSANDDGNGSVAEVVPVFSLTQWLDDSNKLDSRWRDVFQTSSIDNGQLISIGKNVGFWWGIR